MTFNNKNKSFADLIICWFLRSALLIVVCPFVRFLLAFVLYVRLRFIDVNYSFGIFKPLFVLFGHCVVCPSNYGFWLPLFIFKLFFPYAGLSHTYQAGQKSLYQIHFAKVEMRCQMHNFLWLDIITLSWNGRQENIYGDDIKNAIRGNTIKQLHVAVKYR